MGIGKSNIRPTMQPRRHREMMRVASVHDSGGKTKVRVEHEVSPPFHKVLYRTFKAKRDAFVAERAARAGEVNHHG